VMAAPLPCQQRRQRKYACIGRALERQRRQRMAAPAKTTDDMTEAPNRGERRIQRCPAQRV
jgi:hypothetical protein